MSNKSLMRRLEPYLSTGYDYAMVSAKVGEWLHSWLLECSSPDEFDIITALLGDIDEPITTREA